MSNKSYRSELIGLFGCPVDENATVVVMEAAFRALDLNYRYITTLVYPKDLETAINALKAFHMRGTHITIPHKVEVLKYLDHISPTAALMGAVNTVYLEGGETYGENTDGKGFISSFTQSGLSLHGRRVVVLGAGGAARAMTIEMATAGAAQLMIVNRSQTRGEALVDLLNSKTAVHAQYLPWNATFAIPQDTDIVVNATSIGMYPDPSRPDIDYSTLSKNMIVCDGVHNPVQTPFLKEAAQKGCTILDGFSMLINQAAISFKLWTGFDAPIDVMRSALAQEFGIAP